MNLAKKFLYNRTSIFVIPTIVLMVLDYYLITVIKHTNPRYGDRVVIFSIITCLIWVALFIWDQIKIVKDENQQRAGINLPFAFVILIAVLLGRYVACASWGEGMLSLVPFEKIDNGTEHMDNLFFAAVAESYKQHPYASTLLNGDAHLEYHTFSILLMSFVSRIVDLPALLAYNYLYPIVFCPLYIFSILFAISESKKYFEGKAQINFWDTIVFILFVCGIGGRDDVMKKYMVIKTVFFTSESFLVANMLALFFYGISFYVLRKWKDQTKKMLLYKVLIVPTFIFVITWAKISMGMIVTASVMYYVFRTKIDKLRYWILNVFYGCTYLISLKYFYYGATFAKSEGGLKDTIMQGFQWKAFGRYCTGPLGIWGHFIILLSMPLLFVILELVRNKKEIGRAFKTGSLVWAEDMAVITLLCFLPPLIVASMEFDSRWFSMAVEIPAVVLLCGRNYMDLSEIKNATAKVVLNIVCVFFPLFLLYTNAAESPESWVEDEHITDLSDFLLDIREEVGDDAKDYVIYLEWDNKVFHTFAYSNEVKWTYGSSFVCPAMTGVGVINASYYENGKYYDYLSREINTWPSTGMTITDNDHMIPYEEAIGKAKSMGKKKMIHITKRKYEIVDLTKM